MSVSNFHVHSRFCDGDGEPEEYVAKAIGLGFRCIGFSSHAPLPFENPWTMTDGQVKEYCEEIRRLKAKYEGQIQIYLGLEVDYLPGKTGPDSQQFKKLGLDYSIGSIHFMESRQPGEYLSIDGSDENFLKVLGGSYNGDIHSLVQDYYCRIKDMVIQHKPNIVGHFDLVKKNNSSGKYFSEEEDWYRTEIYNTLKIIAGTGTIIEVNTGGIARKYINDLYPSAWILEMCRDLHIPTMLNSDAHSPEGLTAYCKEAIQILTRLGFSQQLILFDQCWSPVELT